MENFLTSLLLIPVVIFFVYFVRSLVAESKVWDQAYRNRFFELKQVLPRSDIFPVILPSIDFPRMGVTSGNLSVIAYIEDSNLVFERVRYHKTPENLEILRILDRPLSSLRFRSLSPDTTYPTSGDYILEGGIFRQANGKKAAVGPYLIGKFVYLVNDVTDTTQITSGFGPKNATAQRLFVEELVARGVGVMDEA